MIIWIEFLIAVFPIIIKINLRRKLIYGNYKFKRQIKKLNNLFKKSIILRLIGNINKIVMKGKTILKISFIKNKIIF